MRFWQTTCPFWASDEMEGWQYYFWSCFQLKDTELKDFSLVYWRRFGARCLLAPKIGSHQFLSVHTTPMGKAEGLSSLFLHPSFQGLGLTLPLSSQHPFMGFLHPSICPLLHLLHTVTASVPPPSIHSSAHSSLCLCHLKFTVYKFRKWLTWAGRWCTGGNVEWLTEGTEHWRTWFGKGTVRNQGCSGYLGRTYYLTASSEYLCGNRCTPAIFSVHISIY